MQEPITTEPAWKFPPARFRAGPSGASMPGAVPPRTRFRDLPACGRRAYARFRNRPGTAAETTVIVTTAGSVRAALATHAVGVAGTCWLLLAGGGVRPAGLMALAAVTLTCLLLALLAQGAGSAAAATAFPQASRATALREKSWRVGIAVQQDPDAPGRARPRAPSGRPAAA